MTTADLWYEKFQRLPQDLQYQALGYVEELLQKWQHPVIDKDLTVSDDDEKSQKILALMQEMASRPNSFTGIDGVEWQNEQRQDRLLPFRD